MLQDLRYGARQLLRTPGFTAFALATLAIGIGLNTALFGLITSIVSRPMPGVHADARTVWITSRSMNGGFSLPLSYPDYAEFRDSSGAFTETAAVGNAEFSLASGGEPVRVRGEIVSGNYFSLLHVPMAEGRGFVASEDRVGVPEQVAVIGYRLWTERFGKEPIVGRRVMLDGAPFTIVGVAPERFNGLTHGPRRDVWVPMAAQPRVQPQYPRMLAERGSIWLAAVGRLAATVTIDQANTRLATVARRIAASDTTKFRDFTAAVVPMRGGMSPHDMNDVLPVALLATGATLLVFLICCANVSNMLLARGVGRRREIGVRLSLGASRRRLVQQLLTESILLATIAGGVGVLLALWANDILASIIPASLDVSANAVTMAFSVGAAALTALIFGVVPALHATRTNLVDALKDGALGFDKRRSRLQRAFVVAQVSLSLTLLIAAGAFLGDLLRSRGTDVGFDASQHVLAASFDLGLQGYTPEQTASFVTTIEQRVAGLPGVTDVSVTNVVPMGERTFPADVALDPSASGPAVRFGEDAAFEVYDDIVRPNFFRTVGLPLIRGRDFAATDGTGSPYVAIVSDDFANRAWPGVDPLGKRVSVTGKTGPFLTVVGVVRESALFGVGERKRAIVFRSHRQFPRARDLTLLVRSSGDATTLAQAVRGQVRALDPTVPVYALQTLAQYRADRLAEPALGSSLLAIVGTIALLLASIGVYAIIAFSVSQRTREIGVRVALGAAKSDVVRVFVREGMQLTALGVVVGLLLSAGAVRVLASTFLGVSAFDAVIFAGVALLLTAIATLAAWIPARRAAGIDPMTALRTE